MEKIASFQVDHTKIIPGVYISRIDGDIVTYDVRLKLPNREKVMDTGAIHTIEHLFATFVRNSKYKNSIIYFGPMGCRTGFYFLVRNLPHDTALELIKNVWKDISTFSGDIPGVSESECGNYRDHDLNGALEEVKKFLPVLEKWTADDLSYPQ